MNGNAHSSIQGVPSQHGQPETVRDITPPSGGFSYEVIRSARRTLAIEIQPGGRVVVRVPRRLSELAVYQFVQQYSDRITKRLRALPAPVAEPDEAQRRAMQAKAGELLPPLVSNWAERLQVTPAGIRITSARTRFGSCSAKGRLCFSYRLMGYPLAAIEYVVLHEVAHLKHLNHGAAFYALLSRHMPDHRQRRALLKAPPVWPDV